MATLQTRVKVSRVSEGYRVNRIYRAGPSTADSALIKLCPTESRDTSALSMVSHK